MNLERAASLLAYGLKPAEVASVLGCTPARISQLISDPSFSLLLESKKAESATEDVEEDALSVKYTSVEHLLLGRIKEEAAGADLKDLSTALRAVSERQERMKARTKGSVAAAQSAPQLTAAVVLPAHVFAPVQVSFNNTNEVTQIGERPLAPLSSAAVTNLFKGKEINHVPSTIPTSTKESSSSPVPQDPEGFLAFAS